MASFLEKLRPGVGRTANDAQTTTTTADPEIQVAMDTIPDDLNKVDDAVPAPDAQPGVRKIEAVTLAWTRTSLAALLGLYVLPFFRT
jgi:hypothetical protein